MGINCFFQTPYFYNHEDSFHITPLLVGNQGHLKERNTRSFIKSRLSRLEIHSFQIFLDTNAEKTALFSQLWTRPYEKYPYLEPSCVHNDSVA